MTCKHCGQPMKESSPSWGHRCLDCRRAYGRAWAKKRKALGLRYNGRASEEWTRSYMKRYYSDPRNRKRRAENMRKYRNDPTLRIRHLARWALNHALASGKINRAPYASCGSKKSQGHHADYTKPLIVVWLCASCHRNEHKRMENIK